MSPLTLNPTGKFYTRIYGELSDDLVAEWKEKSKNLSPAVLFHAKLYKQLLFDGYLEV